MLNIVSNIYEKLAVIRRKLYYKGILKQKKFPVPVISIGNLSVGGTGKTPLTIFTAKKLQEKGYRVCVLSRGYRRKSRGTVVVSDGNSIFVPWEEAGDEPYLMAKNNIPVVVSHSRYEAGIKALNSFPVDVFLLDDGFQHFQLYRDLDILVVDATKPFWEDKPLPAGRLREPAEFYRYADVIVVNRLNRAKNPEKVLEFLKNSEKQLFISEEKIENITDLKKNKNINFLKGKEVGAFSGLGNNGQFFQTVKDLSHKIGFTVSQFISFPDHYSYKKLNLPKKQLWLTTEKDIIKISQKQIEKDNIFALKYSLNLPEDFVQYLENIINAERLKKD
ncbi:tetraacyldisaccharide 4'-kinase [Persephonella atlantica]|uniref:Tetraacyldisaccharide 4'-kinase n=1 Tax=Persephonella atlantica TaxID=2699429 RepID=A0ABS1GH99_9AQUI|nr:tetraacyldisaccharide 4'-kinase [Persephonella atlantica]MBK3332304.1 tetraacyldisaccharide 4'-kinase [Persephonella atlantica]